MEVVKNIVLVFAGASLALIGYLLKRWWEGQQTRERIQDTTALLNLRKQMEDSGLSYDDIQDFRKSMEIKRKEQARIETNLLDQWAEIAVTQTDMNRHAHMLLDVAESQLQYLVETIHTHLQPHERLAFERSQKAWRVYARREANFAGAQFLGGSMASMITMSSLQTLT